MTPILCSVLTIYLLQSTSNSYRPFVFPQISSLPQIWTYEHTAKIAKREDVTAELQLVNAPNAYPAQFHYGVAPTSQSDQDHNKINNHQHQPTADFGSLPNLTTSVVSLANMNSVQTTVPDGQTSSAGTFTQSIGEQSYPISIYLY